MEAVVAVVARHIAPNTLLRIVEELSEIDGNASFRAIVAMLRRAAEARAR